MAHGRARLRKGWLARLSLMLTIIKRFSLRLTVTRAVKSRLAPGFSKHTAPPEQAQPHEQTGKARIARHHLHAMNAGGLQKSHRNEFPLSRETKKRIKRKGEDAKNLLCVFTLCDLCV
jgi:hypothetical protein